MAILLVDRAKMTTSTTGTGTIALGAAVAGFQSFAAAGVTNGAVVRYAIDDGSNWEIGTGTYTSAGTTLSRSPTASSSGGSAISLSGSAVVYVTAAAADVVSGEDDPTNTSGLSAPAIIRGTVYAHLVSGVTLGSGQSTATRQATATALQSAINYSVANGKFFEIEPSIYEIDSTTGINIANTSGTTQFELHGTTMSRIINYNVSGTGAPVLTVGDTTGASYSYNIRIKGLSLEHGSTQSGLTSSVALTLMGLSQCSIEQISAGAPYGTYPEYNCVTVAGPLHCFSCSFRDWALNGAQANMLFIDVIGTGNVFENLYLNNNSAALSGSFLVLANSQAFTEQDFRQINVEHGSCNNPVKIQFSNGLSLRNLHMESIVMTGAYPALITTNGYVVDIDQLTVQNCSFLTANASGVGYVLVDYSPGAGVVSIGHLNMIYDTASQINMPLYLFQGSGLPADANSIIEIGNARLFDNGGNNFSGNLSFDSHMPVPTFQVPSNFLRYEYGKWGSRVTKAVIPVTATYTHYGQHEDATLEVPASITSFTITLAAVQGATGTQAVRTGAVVNIRRQSGTASGTLTVKNDAGTTLTTSTTAATDYYYVFSGTHYATFTPVT